MINYKKLTEMFTLREQILNALKNHDELMELNCEVYEVMEAEYPPELKKIVKEDFVAILAGLNFQLHKEAKELTDNSFASCVDILSSQN